MRKTDTFSSFSREVFEILNRHNVVREPPQKLLPIAIVSFHFHSKKPDCYEKSIQSHCEGRENSFFFFNSSSRGMHEKLKNYIALLRNYFSNKKVKSVIRIATNCQILIPLF